MQKMFGTKIEEKEGGGTPQEEGSSREVNPQSQGSA